MDCEFKLIFEGQADSSSDTKENIVKLLSEKCGYDRSVEIDQLIDSAPFTIKRSEERGELEVFSRELRQVGARVLIVEQIREVRKRPAEHRESGFRSFSQNYADRLHAIMQSVDMDEVELLVNRILAAREEKRQIFFFGNGGSAAIASHIVTDLAKDRFEDENALFRVQSLNDNVSWFSATANDFGYEKVFVSQLKNLLQPEDLVIAISSSGNSPNVVKAIEFANQKGAETWGIVGFDGGGLMREAGKSIYIPTKKGQYGYMEDVASILGHIISIYIYERDRITFKRGSV